MQGHAASAGHPNYSKGLRTGLTRAQVYLWCATLVLFPLLCGLGLWQWERAAEKAQWLSQAEQHDTAIDMARLNDLERAQLPDFQRVRLKGWYRGKAIILLDNRIRQGQVGYEVYTRFIDEQAREYLINRGWVAAPAARNLLPMILTDEHELAIQGVIYRSKGKPLLLSSSLNTETGWPMRVQSIDIGALNQTQGWSLYPDEIRLADDDQPGAFTTGWKLSMMTPEKHQAYAVQWFSLAVVLLILASLAHRKLAHRQEKTDLNQEAVPSDNSEHEL